MSIKKGNKIIAGAPLEPVWGNISGDITDQADLQQVLSEKVGIDSPAFIGTPTAPTPPSGSYDDRIATTSYVQQAIESVDGLPSQAGHNGQFLTTNGTDASWATVDALPAQSGQSGKFLTTNGTTASWGSVDLSGKVDKVTSTSSKNRFYIVTPAGVQSILEGEQSGQTAATVPIRTTTGTIRTATPTDDNDATTKKYVDDGLKEKLDGYNIYVAGSWTGGAHAVNFVTVDYSGADSENGVFIKISMVNSHGNGITGRFLQDVILNVKYTGEVAGTLYRYFAESVDSTMSYSDHKWGDVFWTIDTTNKIVKFFVIMRQYSYTYETPYFRLNASTKGEITQHSGVNSEEYSSGTQYWATIYDYNEIPAQTGQSGKFLTTNGTSVSWSSISQVPSQSGQSGKFLTTNGTTASWANVDVFPSQSGNNGKFLTTNGTSVSWATVDALPTQAGNANKFLTTDGNNASWASIPTEIPSQTGQSGKFLTTNGTTVSWANVAADSEIEWATYGTTTWQQVKDWYDAGKVIAVKNSNHIYILSNYNTVDNSLWFTHPMSSGGVFSYLLLETSNKWTSGTFTAQDRIPAGTSGNIVTYTGAAGVVGSATINDIVPSQTGNSGKFLTTNGSAVSWTKVDSLPDQTGQSGKVLTTNGTAASWENASGSTITYWEDD